MSEPSLIADLLDRLDVERRYEFEERAGILQVENGVDRDTAELLALIDLLRTHPAALISVTAFEVRRGCSTQFVVATDIDAARDRFGADLLRTVDLAALVRERFGGLAEVVPATR